MKHIKILNNLNACSEAIEWAKDYESLEKAWNECKHSDWMIWLDREMNLFTDQQRRLMACRFVRETPLGDGRTAWDLLTDERSRNAVIVAEKYANGDATQQELAAAWSAARAAARSAASAAARSAANAAAWSDTNAAAWSVASAAARSAANAAAWSAQSDIIRSYGNPFNGNEILKG